MNDRVVLGIFLIVFSIVGFAWLNFLRYKKWRDIAEHEYNRRKEAEACVEALTKRLTSVSLDTVDTIQELDKLRVDYQTQQKKLEDISSLLERSKGGDINAACAI